MKNGINLRTPRTKNNARRLGNDRKRALVALLLAPILLMMGCDASALPVRTPETSTSDEALAVAAYPSMAPYPADENFYDASGEFDSDAWQQARETWEQSVDSLRMDIDYAKDVAPFVASSVQLVQDAEGPNKAYSPLNIYLALAMLAQTTAGDSQRQVLELLGADSAQASLKTAQAIWRDAYLDDGIEQCVLANSMWLRDDTAYNEDTLRTLAQGCYASSFAGKMGSNEFNKMLQDWTNEQTGGLLEQQAASLQLDSATVMALVSALYFKAPWADQFTPDNTEKGTFYALSGDMDAEFMRTSDMADYYWDARLGAICLPFRSGGRMWFMLPDEGTTPEQLLEDGDLASFLQKTATNTISESETGTAGSKSTLVHLSIPKFDVTSDVKLVDALQELGITDVFDSERSDFSPLLAQQDVSIYVSQVEHAARVKIDEEGCEAAAFTEIAMAGSALPQDEIDFVLDKPFAFAVTSDTGLPLFVGIVGEPSAADA